MDELKGLFLCVGVGLVVCVIVGLIIGGPAYLITSKTCASKAARLGLEYDFGLLHGCFIKDGDTWVDYDRYRVILHEDR